MDVFNANPYYTDNGELGESEFCICERCGKHGKCEEVPLMGWSERLCDKCTYSAYRSGETF